MLRFTHLKNHKGRYDHKENNYKGNKVNETTIGKEHERGSQYHAVVKGDRGSTHINK